MIAIYSLEVHVCPDVLVSDSCARFMACGQHATYGTTYQLAGRDAHVLKISQQDVKSDGKREYGRIEPDGLESRTA